MSSLNKKRPINPVQGELFESEYLIRKSNRAKYLRINVLPGIGIELVVPRRTSLKQAMHFLEQHREWVTQQLKQYGPQLISTLPEVISLKAIDQHWEVNYQSGQHQQYRIKDTNSSILLSGPKHDRQRYQKKLQQWLRQKAKSTLPGWLDHISGQMDLPYKKLTIRSQKTRWGSCSTSGAISLNDRLMFLPADAVRYVIVHELCHTKHMNHSKRFWNAVRQHCPDYQVLEKQLATAHKDVPAWSYA